ncbi:TetR/AcrR family transcriptional regulator [Mesorhizobium atlanticum]|uniref:TetR/AcrR family transcriptional regulator n=1 Tax=Mesorhizobium atlanticum TaxID=2233532 RepID=A0A330GRA0_9HYPH|nr:TetR/AcrR family transcriptional regulator [Mesorhizobium atlanticum]RAZ73936.1 TetR/AcrR family transcriptional regulator [Mesorhizobium atlanticum]
MARPREFDRDIALQQAIGVFADHGYEGSSTDTLLQAMGISRQSLYDAFGDKRRLYLEALQRYNADSISELIGIMNASSSPLAGLEAALLALAARPLPQGGIGCLGVSATCEFGVSDQEIRLVGEAARKTLISALERRIAQAKAAGEADPELDIRASAQFIAATLSGIKLAARGGASIEALRSIARMAIRSLR